MSGDDQQVTLADVENNTKIFGSCLVVSQWKNN